MLKQSSDQSIMTWGKGVKHNMKDHYIAVVVKISTKSFYFKLLGIFIQGQDHFLRLHFIKFRHDWELQRSYNFASKAS